MTVLKLDHDSPRRPAHWYVRLPWLAHRMGWTVIALGVGHSQSGNWHGEAIIREKLSPATIVAAQAILGSDWARESYNLMRVHSRAFKSPLWRDRFNVLYTSHFTVRRNA